MRVYTGRKLATLHVSIHREEERLLKTPDKDMERENEIKERLVIES